MNRPAVLITGGAKRVGKALALYLTGRGYDIALHYNRSSEGAEELVKEIKAQGVRAELFQADLLDVASYEGMIAEVAACFPHFSALINNASQFERATFQESDGALYQQMMRVNLEAPIFLTQAFAKQMQKGTVINILDTHIHNNQTSHFFYLLAKKALREFTLMAAKELAPVIRVNAVCPGIVLPSGAHDFAYMERLRMQLPLKVNTTLDAICHAVHYLIQAEYLTGQLLNVDGGEHLL